ncbi:MAG: copper chaperone PCu(A)C [Rickettsiaceae bacterium]|nr:copper chaperone PCu(A)C [Rickettsiaceae bacterium]
MIFIRKILQFSLLLICFNYEIFAQEENKAQENEILKQVVIENAQARQATKNTAIYFGIKNNSKQNIVITGGKTTDAMGRIELHEVIKENGVAKMRSIDKLVVPAGSKISFKPGGLHFMILGLPKELKDGDKFEFALETNEGLKNFEVLVKEKINIE